MVEGSMFRILRQGRGGARRWWFGIARLRERGSRLLRGAPPGCGGAFFGHLLHQCAARGKQRRARRRRARHLREFKTGIAARAGRPGDQPRHAARAQRHHQQYAKPQHNLQGRQRRIGRRLLYAQLKLAQNLNLSVAVGLGVQLLQPGGDGTQIRVRLQSKSGRRIRPPPGDRSRAPGRPGGGGSRRPRRGRPGRWRPSRAGATRSRRGVP